MPPNWVLPNISQCLGIAIKIWQDTSPKNTKFPGAMRGLVVLAKIKSITGSALLGNALFHQHNYDEINQGIVPDENSGNSKKGG